MSTIDWSYHRNGRTTCAKTQGFLAKHKVTVTTQADAKKATIKGDAALGVLKDVDELYVPRASASSTSTPTRQAAARRAARPAAGAHRQSPRPHAPEEAYANRRIRRNHVQGPTHLATVDCLARDYYHVTTARSRSAPGPPGRAAWGGVGGPLGAPHQKGRPTMPSKGFSHIGLSTLDLDATRDFYENVLKFKAVRCDILKIKEGGQVRHIFFDTGRDQLLAFMEARDVPGVAAR